MKTSSHLVSDKIYSRQQLQEKFNIIDATIRTGVFHPKGHDSIWLFVTEEKTDDRTQYKDYLEGEFLYWDGQISGRTDDKIINHEHDGNEILVFYRKSKREYPNSSFRYVGQFKYISHTPGQPSHFKLCKI